MRAPVLVLTLILSGCATSEAPLVPHHAVTAHNSKNSLDWAGTYRGVLPCADCPGIETVVVLKSDGRYTATSKYLDRDVAATSREGRFTWNEAGSAIRLEDGTQYQVGEGRLFRLAQDGSRITGPNAEHYVLSKEHG